MATTWILVANGSEASIFSATANEITQMLLMSIKGFGKA